MVSGWSTPRTRSRMRVALCWLLKAFDTSFRKYSIRARCLREGRGDGGREGGEGGKERLRGVEGEDDKS